jgi:hypothetical protein
MDAGTQQMPGRTPIRYGIDEERQPEEKSQPVCFLHSYGKRVPMQHPAQWTLPGPVPDIIQDGKHAAHKNEKACIDLE